MDLGPLIEAVREVERYVAGAGWDQPVRLFALARTTDLLEREPGLVAALGIDVAAAAELTPVEQDVENGATPLDEWLPTLAWPAEVAGAALVLERVVLPPEAEALLDDPAAAAADDRREDVRIAVAVLRDGTTECAVRSRSHDADDAVLHGPDLVPVLADALLATFD